jgi:hypothetical protein
MTPTRIALIFAYLATGIAIASFVRFKVAKEKWYIPQWIGATIFWPIAVGIGIIAALETIKF